MRLRRITAAAALAAAAAAGLTACSESPGASPAAAPHAGSYPVAVAGSAIGATPAVRSGQYALVAAGDPVRVHLRAADLVVTTSGPDVDVPEPSPGTPINAPSAEGVLTVTATSTRGSAVLDAKQFLGLNEEQDRFALRPDHASGTVSPGHPVTLHLRSRFATGHTTLTWQPLGKPLVTWDFTVEID